jgi:hypothetical protein
MRRLTDAARLRQFMRLLGRRATTTGRAYLVGGACAVLLDWRPTTIDIDLELDPSLEPLLRDLPAIKEELQVNREALIDFHHYDFYAQALAKIERAHAKDLDDVREMTARRLIDPKRLLEFFNQIEAELYRYPAIDPPSFRRAVERAAADG